MRIKTAEQYRARQLRRICADSRRRTSKSCTMGWRGCLRHGARYGDGLPPMHESRTVALHHLFPITADKAAGLKRWRP
jgi:hypothetical protein